MEALIDIIKCLNEISRINGYPVIDAELRISECKEALLGFSDLEITEAAISWGKMSTWVPKANDIVYFIAYNKGLNPWTKMGLN